VADFKKFQQEYKRIRQISGHTVTAGDERILQIAAGQKCLVEQKEGQWMATAPTQIKLIIHSTIKPKAKITSVESFYCLLLASEPTKKDFNSNPNIYRATKLKV